eukprot:366158-Chlamydomonas_euryale.AAC.3
MRTCVEGAVHALWDRLQLKLVNIPDGKARRLAAALEHLLHAQLAVPGHGRSVGWISLEDPPERSGRAEPEGRAVAVARGARRAAAIAVARRAGDRGLPCGTPGLGRCCRCCRSCCGGVGVLNTTKGALILAISAGKRGGAGRKNERSRRKDCRLWGD